MFYYNVLQGSVTEVQTADAKKTTLDLIHVASDIQYDITKNYNT